MKSKKKIALLMGLVSISTIVGCGGSSNNDQGTSFTAVGYYTDTTGATGTGGTIKPLFTDISPTRTDGLYEIIFMGFQNNLSKQSIQIERINCRYEVEGSFIDVPSDSFPGGLVLGRAGNTTSTTTATAANGGASTTTSSPSRGYKGFLIVSPDIYSFLNNNKAYLPELPFRMTASCAATGISQAGDIITTNELDYFVQFVDESECCTGTGTVPGFQSGTGSGGDLIVAEGTQANTTNNINSNVVGSNGVAENSSSDSETIAP